MAWPDDFDWGTAPPGGGSEVYSGGGGNGDEGEAPNPLKAKSWGSSTGSTSMPTWWHDWTKNYLTSGNNATQGFDWMKNAYDNYFSQGPRYQQQTDQGINQLQNYMTNQYSQMPQQIEQQRQNMINQMYAGLPQMRELYQPAMEDMSRRGILNSSVTGDALNNIQTGVNRGLMQQQAAANTWAGGQQMDYLNNMPSVLSNMINTMMGASQGNAAFGQQAASVGGNYQNMLLELQRMLQQQQSGSNQGSETYR